MDTQSRWAQGVDIRQPSSARVYDVHLGGSHNFQVDRDLAEQAAAMMPTLPAVLRANRSFLRRAVQHLAELGVRQFLDLGSGIPTVGNVHEIAQRVDPRCRVVYVDRDLVAVEHSRAILRGNDGAVAIRADFRDVDEVLGDEQVRSVLDFDQPVAVLFFAVLHFVPDSDDPAGIVARYADALSSGSYVAISHAGSDGAESRAQASSLYNDRIGGFFLRSHATVSAMFGDLELIEPGVVDLLEWRPDPGEKRSGEPLVTGPGGVGRKP
ncbi:S-adenosyl methyltransferase [Saccharopolyspora antimicrobica]|uniref:S-adenosyl methyltransferase n=1 Tax=Saccharopolyspora antimicrobica TaxID=455193 RepID=A0A1I4QPN8_9PSEU|nr:SAM-dependent methyltransferase [Saccharopolyspora antimicrobica]RKT88348.1 S-adenosyl methyltransferase [Saccharopolyspora antimicrobica]SFM42007.1 S-adenosyl methyltransferase [Saccharopolyspora antimicrobica]